MIVLPSPHQMSVVSQESFSEWFFSNESRQAQTALQSLSPFRFGKNWLQHPFSPPDRCTLPFMCAVLHQWAQSGRCHCHPGCIWDFPPLPWPCGHYLHFWVPPSRQRLGDSMRGRGRTNLSWSLQSFFGVFSDFSKFTKSQFRLRYGKKLGVLPLILSNSYEYPKYLFSSIDFRVCRIPEARRFLSPVWQGGAVHVAHRKWKGVGHSSALVSLMR